MLFLRHKKVPRSYSYPGTANQPRESGERVFANGNGVKSRFTNKNRENEILTSLNYVCTERKLVKSKFFALFLYLKLDVGVAVKKLQCLHRFQVVVFLVKALCCNFSAGLHY